MSFRDRKNRAQYAFQPGVPVVFTIPEGGKVLSGRVIVTGNVVVTGGTTNGTLIDEGGPIGLIKRITITANKLASSRYPGGKIVDDTPRALLRYAITQHSGKFYGEMAGSTLGAGAAGTYPIYLSIPVFFADCVQRNQMMTALNMDSGTYASVQVKIDTASDLTGCFSGNDRSIATSSLMVQWKDDRLGLSGDTTPIFQEDHILQIMAVNSRTQDAALPVDGAFTQMMILAEQGAQHTLSDAIVNKVVFEGASLAFSEYGNDIREQMLTDEWFDPSTTATGQYFLDFTDGVQQFNNCPAPGLLVQLDLNNPSGAALDESACYTRRIFPLAPAGNVSAPMPLLIVIVALVAFLLYNRKAASATLPILAGKANGSRRDRWRYSPGGHESRQYSERR